MNFFSICLLHVIAFIVCFLFIDRNGNFIYLIIFLYLSYKVYEAIMFYQEYGLQMTNLSASKLVHSDIRLFR